MTTLTVSPPVAAALFRWRVPTRVPPPTILAELKVKLAIE
jgi:hypothetical protein